MEEKLSAPEQGKKRPSFVKANSPKQQEEQPRRKRAAEHNQARHREEPTRFESHRLESCPDWGEGLVDYRASRSRQIIGNPEPQPIEGVEHQVEESCCQPCRQWHRPVGVKNLYYFACDTKSNTPKYEPASP
jgi:hypothetical protein